MSPAAGGGSSQAPGGGTKRGSEPRGPGAEREREPITASAQAYTGPCRDVNNHYMQCVRLEIGLWAMCQPIRAFFVMQRAGEEANVINVIMKSVV